MPTTRPTTSARLPRVIACALVAVLSGLFVGRGIEAGPAAQERAVGAGEYLVMTASGVVRIPQTEWKAMPSPTRVGESFEQRTLENRQRFPRLVTVSKTHMTDDTRVGTPISPTEYLELSVEQPGTLTVQVRVDKGRYWVMSRETLLAPSSPALDTSAARHFSDDEFGLARLIFESEIERTRFLLQSQF